MPVGGFDEGGGGVDAVVGGYVELEGGDCAEDTGCGSV